MQAELQEQAIKIASHDRLFDNANDPRPYIERATEFAESVEAVDTILTKRLFLASHSSVEKYFATLGYSRSEAYRLSGCWPVLEALKGFQIIPPNHNVAQNIRKMTMDPQMIVALWCDLLDFSQCKEGFWTGAVIKERWDIIKKKRAYPLVVTPTIEKAVSAVPITPVSEKRPTVPRQAPKQKAEPPKPKEEPQNLLKCHSTFHCPISTYLH